ncbi:MAG TPA: hypothetical protein DIW23_00735 [Anaerolineae bacterium]|nr:hypothetical protein [Anaerolineae bacterium]
MSKTLSQHDTEVWQRLVESEKEFYIASQAFLKSDVDRVSLLKEKLYSQEKNTAYYFLNYLKKEEVMQLFDVLVSLASTGHSNIKRVRDAILSLPHDWVIKNIEPLVEPLLIDGTDDEYRRFLELYYELDKDLTRKLAQRATQHTDPHIKEAGEDFLKILEGKID